MSDFDYTCRHCAKPGTIKNFASFGNSYEEIRTKNLRDLNAEEYDFAFGIRSIHSKCFINVLDAYWKNIHAGSYVSTTIFDDDEHRDVYGFYYVHKILDNSCEIWTINSSPRYVRKGGEFLEKEIVPIEDAISFMFVDKSNTATVNDLREVFANHVREERRRFMMEIVEAETENMVSSEALEVYPTIDTLDDYREFLDDVRVFEENMRNAEILAIS